MTILNFNNANKVLVIGPIYDNFEILLKIEKLVNQYDRVIFNGSLTYPLDNFKTCQRLEHMSDLLKLEKVIYNISDIDYKLSMTNNMVADWLKHKPNAVNIKFNRGTSVLIISGGISPEMKQYKDLESNLELSFVKEINNKSWHYSYNGRFGYVVSNNLLSEEEPKFFNYSAQIGIKHDKGKVYAQEINENGLGNTFLL